MQAVVASWGMPTTRPAKLWTALEVLASYLDPETVDWIQLIRAGNPADVPRMTFGAKRALGIILNRAGSGCPPPYWSPLAPRRSLGWEGLTDDDRAFLLAARNRARLPGGSLWIFGSRSTSTHVQDSDYDLMLVYPDDIPEWGQDYAMEEIRQVAIQFGIPIDLSKVSAATFRAPSSRGVDNLLYFEVWAYGVEVPN